MKRLTVHPEARAEYDDAAAYYEAQRPGLGTDFRARVVGALRRVRSNPRGGVVMTGTPCRKVLVDRFRYKVICVELGDRVVVVAIAHPSRHPDYWHSRLADI